ncbi:hypothetical protein [Kitasatospora sp. NPDC086791]|uniref:hypothetical protein n=1 Tax=unclassified Kitasatospora TaxID=2633591 RepID=UPI00343326A0
MKASARTARQILRTRSAESRATAASRRPLDAAKLAKSCRRRARSLNTHALAAGVDRKTAESVTETLRKIAKRKNIKHTEKGRTRQTMGGRGRVVKTVRRYSRAKVVELLTAYNPRSEKNREARRLMLAA